MAKKTDKPEKPKTEALAESKRGLNIILAALKKSGYGSDSKEVKEIQALIDRQ